MLEGCKKVRILALITRLCFVPRGDLLFWKFKNYKYQITNIKQFPMTEIRNSKHFFVLKGFGH